jgi:hypothetical protein
MLPNLSSLHVRNQCIECLVSATKLILGFATIYLALQLVSKGVIQSCLTPDTLLLDRKKNTHRSTYTTESSHHGRQDGRIGHLRRLKPMNDACQPMAGETKSFLPMCEAFQEPGRMIFLE